MNCDSVGGFPHPLKIRRWDDENGKVIIHNSPWTHSDALPLPLEQHVFHSIHFCILPHRQFRERDENCQRQIRCVFQYFQFSQWVFSLLCSVFSSNAIEHFTFLFIDFTLTRTVLLFFCLSADAHTKRFRRFRDTVGGICWESAIQCCSRNQFIKQQRSSGKSRAPRENRGKTSAAFAC